MSAAINAVVTPIHTTTVSDGVTPLIARDEKYSGGNHGGGVDQRADRRGPLHRIRQPDVQRELARFSHRTAKDQQRDERCARTEHGKSRVFNATMPFIVEEKCAAAVIERKHAEEKSHVSDTRGEECLFCRSRGARTLDPESDEQIRSEPDKFPKNEKQKQTIRDNQAEHGAGKKREVCEKPG